MTARTPGKQDGVKVAIVPIVPHVQPLLMDFENSLSLTAIVRDIAARWEIKNPEQYCLKYSKFSDKFYYVTEENRHELKNGDVLSIALSPSLRARDIYDKVCSNDHKSIDILELANLLRDPTFATQFISLNKGKGVQLLMTMIEKSPLSNNRIDKNDLANILGGFLELMKHSIVSWDIIREPFVKKIINILNRSCSKDYFHPSVVQRCLEILESIVMNSTQFCDIVAHEVPLSSVIDFISKGSPYVTHSALGLINAFILKADNQQSILHELSISTTINDTLLQQARGDVVHDIVHQLSMYHISTLTLAMKEGGGKMKPCNITLHGPPGVGKSSLKRVILGQPPLPKEKQNATPIIENAARAVSIDRLTASGMKMLAEVDNKSLIKMLAKKAKTLPLSIHSSQPHDSTQHHTQPHDSTQHHTQPHDSTQHHIPESQHPVPVESVSDSPLNTNNSEALQSIKEQMAKQVEPSSELFDVDWIYLTDSGGQPQFQDVLPLLYHNESLHIVVIRLDEGLDDKPKVRYYIKGEDVYTLPDHLTLSNREIIERACQIAEAQATSGKFVPKVMVVGTHKDKLRINSKAKLKEINKELTKLHQKYNRVLIRKSEDEVIFAVNTMVPVGKKRQQYTEELQECILKAAEETGNVIDVPLKWLAFHLDLDKTGGIVRKSECYKTGEILGMGRSDVEEALKYLNKVGLLLYYPDDVPDLVFTKIGPLIGRLSRLITASFITPGSSITAPYDRLRQKGLFNKSLLPTIFEDLYNSEEEFHDDDFLKLLECLKIAVHVEDDDYFLPSALSLEPPVDESLFPMSCVPLIYSWDEQILPHGFFPTLVVELLQQKESDADLHFELRNDVIQCRHEIQLIVAKRRIPGVVKLGDRKRWVEVCYSGDMRYCAQLRVVIDVAIVTVLKVFEHTCLRFPTVGFRCPLCDSGTSRVTLYGKVVNRFKSTRLCDIDDHYCILSFDQQTVSCSRNESNYKTISPDMSCWKLDDANISNQFSNESIQDVSRYNPEELTTKTMNSDPVIPSRPVSDHYKNQSTTVTNILVDDKPLTDYSPSNIFKRHMSEMLGVISDTERLANDLSSVDLIPYPVKDDIITTNLSRYQKASKLLNEIQRSLRSQILNKPEILISYCEVLKTQQNPALTRIAQNMLKELGVQ